MVVKWGIIFSACFVSLMALISWADVAFYQWPTTADGWIPLIAFTSMSFVLVRLSYIGWDTVSSD